MSHYCVNEREFCIESFGEDGIEPIYSLKGHSDVILGFSLSRDGQRATTTSADKSLKIWDLTAHHELAKYKTGDVVRSVSMNNEGSQLLLCSYRAVELVAVNDGLEVIWSTRAHSADWNFDFSKIMRSTGDAVKVCNASGNFDEIIRFTHLKLEYGTLLATCPSADLVAADGFTGSLFLIDVRSGELHHWENGYAISVMCFSSDGTKLIVGSSSTVLIFTVDPFANDEPTHIFSVIASEFERIAALALSHDLQRALVEVRNDVTSSSNTYEYDVQTRTIVRQWKLMSHCVYVANSVVLL